MMHLGDFIYLVWLILLFIDFIITHFGCGYCIGN